MENIAIQAVILLPLLSFLLATFRTAWLNSFLLFISCLSATFLLYQTWIANDVYQLDFLWFTLKATPFKIRIWVDNTTSAMFFIVSFVATLVHLFSMAYMKEDKHKGRYFALLGFFTFAMQSLLLTSNLLIIYIFWELVGFCSYLLIGFWHEKPSASQAAKKAFLFNRVGDIGLLLAISLVWFSFGTLDIRSLMQMSIAHLPPYLAVLIGIGFVMATCGKSAQLPLSVWLPDAMEAPTPVSALIHAATMVAAGIYLLIRVNFLLVPDIQFAVVIIGTLTALLSAFAALSQTDMKRLLAYSTVSQLGYMMTAVGLGNTQAALFHLLTHAFFKAGLFLCAGVVIHYLHEQDMRKMGGLRKQLPLTFISYTTCAFSLAGLPFFSGFLSKDLIIDAALVWAGKNTFFYSLVPISLLLTSLLTAVYIGKQWSLVFLKAYRGESALRNNANNLFTFDVPTLLLAVFSLGIVFSPNPFSPEKSWLLSGQVSIANHWLTVVSAFISCFGLFVGWCMYGCEDMQQNIFFKHIFKSRLYKLSYHFFYIDFFYYQIVKKTRNWLSAKSLHFFFIDRFHEKSIIDWSIQFSIKLAHFDNRLLDRAVKISGVGLVTVGLLAAWFDKHIIDGGTHLTAWAMGQGGKKVKAIQNGKVQSYFAWAMIGVVLLIVLVWWQK
ncbi:MAG: NADH-quinone oxidoreductase subunit L [Cytophagales bacterium]|nr:MAG: NADH-quinone oxidoreductase subunit L [Cytophagales bacterium]